MRHRGVRGAAAVVLAAVAVAGGLTVVAPPAFADPGQLTISVAPAQLHVGDTPTVSGTLSGTAAPDTNDNQPVTITRTVNGTASAVACTGGPVTTDANGDYACHDPQPVARGQVTYTAEWHSLISTDPGATAETTRTVVRNPTALSLQLSTRRGTAGHVVRLVAHLGSATTSRTVSIFAKPYQQDRRRLAHGTVDANGDLTARMRVFRRTTFTASFGGDAAYLPRAVHHRLLVRADLRERLRRSYGIAGGYRLYHHDVNPALVTAMTPVRSGLCLHFRAQRRYSGAWHSVAVSGCVDTNSQGLALGVFLGHHVLNEPYRLRAEWRGSTAVLRRNGAWQLLRFRA